MKNNKLFKVMGLALLNAVGFLALATIPLSASASINDPIEPEEPGEPGLRFCYDDNGPHANQCPGSEWFNNCAVVQISVNPWDCCQTWINDDSYCCQRSCLTFSCRNTENNSNCSGNVIKKLGGHGPLLAECNGTTGKCVPRYVEPEEPEEPEEPVDP